MKDPLANTAAIFFFLWGIQALVSRRYRPWSEWLLPIMLLGLGALFVVISFRLT